MANVKISALPAATAISAADLLPVVQGGVTKQVTPDLLPLSAATATALAGKDASGAAAAAQAAAIQRANHTGTQSADTLTDGTTNKAYTATERTKLAGVAAGATANRSDAAVDTLLGAKADLVGGVIPTAQIPALALNTAVTVASQAAMLALTTTQVQPGDVAVRTDGAGTFILTAADPTVFGNWTRLNAPTDAVTTVNGQTGTVVLSAANVGADVAGAAAAAVVGLAPLVSPAFTGTPTISGTAIAKTTDVRAVVNVPAATGVAATDWANITAAVTKAQGIVAAGGSPVIAFPACPTIGGTFTPYNLGNHTIPISQGIAYRGVPPVLASDVLTPGQYMPDGEFHFVGGTVLKGDGTAPGFWDGVTDQATVAASWGTGQIAGVEISGFGLDTFSTGIRSGAVNAMGLVWSKIDEVYARGCGWGAWFANYQHVDFGIVTTCLCTTGGLYFASLVASTVLIPGNSTFENLFVKTPNGGNTARGIVFEGRTITAGQVASLTIGTIGTVQVNAFNRATVSQTATLTNGSATVTVTDGSVFRAGMPVVFPTTVGGFAAGVRYYVRTVTGNALTLAAAAISGPTIPATGAGTGTVTTTGFHGVEIASDGGQMNGQFSLIDVEGGPGVYFENASGSVVTNSTATPYIARRNSNIQLRFSNDSVFDFDPATEAFRSLIDGDAVATFVQAGLGGIRASGTERTPAFSLGQGRVLSAQVWPASYYRTSEAGSYGNQNLANGQMFASLFEMPAGRRITRLGINVANQDAAGSVVRVGIYGSDRNGLPATLLLDAGTLDASAVGGYKELTLDAPIPEGTVWIASVAQGSTGSVWVTGLTPRPVGNPEGSAAVGGNSVNGLYQNGVTGALPGTFAITGQTTMVPSVAVKAG